MVRTHANLPSGHGELLVEPEFGNWPELMRANVDAAAGRDFTVAGLHCAVVRDMARSEALRMAAAYSERLGVPVRPLAPSSGAVVMTGHQPELYHAGVWAKDFLLQGLSELTGAAAVDIVVDSDGFESLGAVMPCLGPAPTRCSHVLAQGRPGAWYGGEATPSPQVVEEFCSEGDRALSTLDAQSVRRHFATFCTALSSAEKDAHNLAELVTFARRRYEASAGTDYAELPVTDLVRGRAFSAFFVDLALNADRFAASYNAELDAYREVSRTRSAAQPFPNLGERDGAVELPLWWLGGGKRRSIWAVRSAEEIELRSGDEALLTLPADEAAAVEAFMASGAVVAPKALALTLFVRLFCCDLFIHGVGGGRYDRVTDAVCRRYYGIEPPAFVVASLTMYLPLGAHNVTEEEVAEAKERLARLAHNPDALLGEVVFENEEERERARQLALEKTALVSAISAQGADRKELGRRIRDVNEELGMILAPLRHRYEYELERLESQRAASEIFTDRSYPFCLWSPNDIADKVR
jgi:hypothetical protein